MNINVLSKKTEKLCSIFAINKQKINKTFRVPLNGCKI